ncbi:MAG: hypothetical protein ACHP78_18300 [Terriglobales bacterium]
MHREKFQDFFALVGIGGTFAAWGWSAVAPNSSVVFGSILLLIAVLAVWAAVRRMFESGRFASIATFLILMAGFAAFDYFVVVKPRRERPLKNLLVRGYQISSECQVLPHNDQMPLWMRDQSKTWQTQAEQMIAQDLGYKYSQIWNRAVIYGLVSDENTAGYQCLWLSNKVGALETIIAQAYDPTLQHRAAEKPIHWFEAGADGKVDVSGVRDGDILHIVGAKPKAK